MASVWMWRGGAVELSSNCVQKLLVDEYDKAQSVLFHHFSQRNPPVGSTAEWSLAAEAQGYIVGEVYAIHGGAGGRGQLRIEAIGFPRGIFRT